MSNVYKIVEDFSKDAGRLLGELSDLTQATKAVRFWLTDENNAEGLSLPRYVIKGREALMELPIREFNVNYPTVVSVVSNGQLDASDTGNRLHDAIYKLGQLNERLSELRYLVKQPEDREGLSKLAGEIAGDLAIYIITQYRLTETETAVYLCVEEFCSRNGILPKGFYTDMCRVCNQMGVEPYGYEVISPYREKLLEIDAAFLSNCEEAGFPLSSEISEAICNGSMTILEAQRLLNAHMQDSTETAVDGLNTSNMISRLHLD